MVLTSVPAIPLRRSFGILLALALALPAAAVPTNPDEANPLRPAPGVRLHAEERAPGSRPARASSTQVFDQAGGDDVLITTHTDIRPFESPSFDIADNGDLYVAITVDVDATSATDREIRVYWSTDDGRSWSLFGTLGSATAGTEYADPSLHIGEGAENRLYVACEYHTSGSVNSIRVAWKPLASPGTAWTERTALASAGINFLNPSLHSSEYNVGFYYLFLAAQGDDGNGDDIWFTRSIDFDNTWAAGYTIASLSSNDRDYVEPKVTYGSTGVVNCTYTFQPAPATGLDNAIRYRRALNSAASSGDWQAAVFLTPNSNGEDEDRPDIAASNANQDVILAYVRSIGGSVQGTRQRRSADLGASWDTTTFTVGTRVLLDLVAAPLGNYVMAGDNPSFDETGVLKATQAAPTTWTTHTNLQDRDYDDGLLNSRADVVATSPTLGNRAAIVWTRINSTAGQADSLFFDAEWLTDPGWPNLAPGFPVTLAADVTSPPAICEVDGDVQREIVVGDALGNVYVLNHDGTAVPGWPRDVGSIPYNAPIAVGDVNADGRYEVVVGNTAGQVFAYRPDGSLLPGFPHAAPAAENTYVSLGRFGPDHRLDIVVASGPWLFKVRGDGVRDPNLTIHPVYDLAGPAAIGDVDGDGDAEYVVAQTGGIVNVIRPENSTQAFRSLTASARTFSDPVALADLNLDGDLEILAATDQGDLYVLNPDGTDFPGWPNTVSAGTLMNSPIAANILGTGAPEVFWSEETATSPQIHGYQATGAVMPGFPVGPTTGWFLHASPIVDYMIGSPEVFVGSRDGLGHSWANNGTINAGWPKTLSPGRVEMSPASGDVDDDGKLDLVFATVTPGKVILVETNATLVRTPNLAGSWWPMYGYNPERQFCLACETYDWVAVPHGPVSDLRLSAAPNPGRWFTFTLELPRAGHARLDVFDLSGRRVRTLLDANVEPGLRSLHWDGRLEGGVRAAAGIYHARLVTRGTGADTETVRKVALLP